MDNTIDGRQEPKPNAEHDPVERGKKAIEADKLINKKEVPEQDKNKEEQQDAETWRNEG